MTDGGAEPGRFRASVFGFPYICHRQLHEDLAVVLILIERKGDVEGALVLVDVLVALGCPPRDGPEDPAVLSERHFKVPILQLPRPVDDFDAPRGKHRARVSSPERRKAADTSDDAAGDRSKA